MLTKDMSIMEVVQKYPQTIKVFQEFGMGCIGCAAAHFENIVQGAADHGMDIDQLMQALNESVS
jgi:hybrid cluster-associated redox disulfide protein